MSPMCSIISSSVDCICGGKELRGGTGEPLKLVLLVLPFIILSFAGVGAGDLSPKFLNGRYELTPLFPDLDPGVWIAGVDRVG